MKKAFLIPLIICSGIIISCGQTESVELSKTEIWKLGWRMVESSKNENYDVAELQFDSIMNSRREIDLNFLITGLEVKSKLGKDEEIEQIVSQQKEEVLQEVCTQTFLVDSKSCKGYSEEKVENESLQLELVKMLINDQYVRSNLMNDLLEKYNLTKKEVVIDSLGADIDVRNTGRLQEIISEYGFPTKQQVGKDGMDAVFYIIQHAVQDKEWQANQLVNIKQAVEKRDMNRKDYAYLYDRIKMLNGEKQLYGTQFGKVDPINKTIELADVEDLENLDKRRMELGMMPIDMYKRYLQEAYAGQFIVK